jgi:uncharacterized protein GlcG (DUF336 family)
MVIAIRDPAGTSKALERMDSAPFLSVEIALNDEWTAVSLGIATRAWEFRTDGWECGVEASAPLLFACPSSSTNP